MNLALHILAKSYNLVQSVFSTMFGGTLEDPKEYPLYPEMIVQGRYLPEDACYMLYRWLSWLETQLKDEYKNHDCDELIQTRLELIKKMKLLVLWRTRWWEIKLEEFMKSGNDFEPIRNTSYMKKYFKPTISLPSIDFERMNKIFKSAEQEPLDSTREYHISEYFLILDRLEKLCGVGDESFVKFKKRKRKGERSETLTAVYRKLNHQERKNQLHKSLWHFKKYNKTIQIAGQLRGRLENVANPYIVSVSKRIDKSGLATRIFQKEHYAFDNITETLAPNSKFDIPSIVFTCLAVSEFSVRKEFTISSQQQGALDTCLLYLLNIMKGRESFTRWELVASLHPVEDVVTHVDQDMKHSMLRMLLEHQVGMAHFLKNQWNVGVRKCCKNDMMVPSRGTGVDSSGWNSVAGAWNNSIRIIRAVCKSLGEEPPLLIKVMKLTAADQMEWAMLSGKASPEDILVFQKLTLDKNITPWGIVLQSSNNTTQDIGNVCLELQVDPARWLGFAQERTMETKEYGDVICGCSVPNDVSIQYLLKKTGAFGYKPAKHQE